MAIPKKGAAPAGRKSMKMEADELTEKIKACVKEALDEQAEAKAEGEEGTEDAVAEVAPADISGLIEDAMAVVAEKRKSRKEAAKSWATSPPRKSWRPSVRLSTPPRARPRRMTALRKRSRRMRK